MATEVSVREADSNFEKSAHSRPVKMTVYRVSHELGYSRL